MSSYSINYAFKIKHCYCLIYPLTPLKNPRDNLSQSYILSNFNLKKINFFKLI